MSTSASEVRKEAVSEFIYGTITVLALLLVLDETGAGAWVSVVTIIASTYALALTKVYATSVAEMLAERSRLRREDLYEIWVQIRPLTVYAQLPTLILTLAGIGLIPPDAAFWVCYASGVLTLFAAGFFVGVRAGLSLNRSLVSGLFNGSVGVAIIILKFLTH